MARSRRPVKNPSITQLEWVDKNYPDWVWYYTVLGFFEATGMDRYAHDFTVSVERLRTGQEDAHIKELGIQTLTIPESESVVVAAMISSSGNKDTIYDRHLPWLAMEIARAGSDVTESLEKAIAGVYPNLILPVRALKASDFVESAGVTQEELDSAVEPGRLITVDLFEYFRDGSALEHAFEEASDIPPAFEFDVDGTLENQILDASSEIGALVEGFGTIVDWAEATGTNLDDHTARSAYNAAHIWKLYPPEGAGNLRNPHKRKAKAKRKSKTPEWKRLLDRSHRLWETYDAKPLKKNLLAFGAHIEKMKTSGSAKVKTEARRAERAFSAEFKARDWKR